MHGWTESLVAHREADPSQLYLNVSAASSMKLSAGYLIT
jgi:hypothetical protein